MKIPEKQPETRSERIKAWREHIPNYRHGYFQRNYDKAMSGKSLRAAITAKCLDCMCWQQPEVNKCDIVTCPLHPYRPNLARRRRRGCNQEEINLPESSVAGVR